jgi:catechol 2,3-dioxygenase-like lactoylglutathione lyase family enzyme
MEDAMLTAIDHLVVLVPDLAAACQAYERLGFTITPGGEHPVGTHNALIPFADGAYIELIAFKEPDRPHDHPWWPYLATGGGLVDIALLSDDLDADLAAAAARDLRFALRVGRRRRPDGQEVAWRAARPAVGSAVPLPFLVQDATPRALRVPAGAACRHPNGARGVAAVYIAVDDLPAAAAAYGALLGGSTAEETDVPHFAVHGFALPCGETRLVLLPRAAVAERLPEPVRRRGPGICAAALAGPAAGRTLDIATAQGTLLFLGGA